MELTARDVSETTAPYDLGAQDARLGAGAGSAGRALRQGRRSRCPAAAPSARGRSICTSRASSQLGAEIELQRRLYPRRAPNGPERRAFVFPIVSVGATENLLMAATLAEGETVLDQRGARARDRRSRPLPDARWARRSTGIGTDTPDHPRRRASARRRATPSSPTASRPAPTLMAAAITGGEVELVGARGSITLEASRRDADAGRRRASTTTARRSRSRGNGALAGVDVMTEPYPGFPTDLQAQLMALMATASGAAMITETIFENRFMHVPELTRMGADIIVHGRHRDGARRRTADRRAGHGDGSARLGEPGARRPRRRRRDRRQPRLSSRPRL